jgi:acetate kinase
MRVLVPNLGSTSLKYQLLEMDDERVLARGRIESVRDHRAAVDRLVAEVEPPVEAIGLKAVHGGARYAGSHVIDDDVLVAMRELSSVAPVHNPIYVQAIELLRDALPGVPMVGVFEPGFHETIPEEAYLYGVPYEWVGDHGIRRYGFHGSSHRYVSQQVRARRLVSCHLGGSSSICAIRDGRSVDSSFGFSPQSGVEHGTRCGDLDPFAVLHVMERTGMTPAETAEVLCRESGLLGISGVGGELRELEEAADGGNHRAALAIDVFVHGVKRWVGACAAVLGGLDALAFAGGIGENSPRVRAAVCDGLEFLGVELDPERNREPPAGGVISPDGAAAAVVVVRTDEELVVARETVRVLRGTD